MQEPYEINDWPLTKTGVTKDWMNALVRTSMEYQIAGIEGIVKELSIRPVLTYEEEAERLLALEHEPESYERNRRNYAVSDENRDVVKRIDNHVLLLNRAAREGRLTNSLYKRIYRHIVGLVEGK